MKDLGVITACRRARRDIPNFYSSICTALAALAVTLSLSATHARAAPIVSGPDANGFRWCTVGSAGNTAYAGLPPGQYDSARGRGRVDYDFRIARTEVSTGQWLEFLNAVGDAGLTSSLSVVAEPTYWGGALAGTRPDGSPIWMLNPSLPDAARLPAAGMSWRDAAMYCNWLHNNKAATPDGIGRGAYDASTFGWAPHPDIPTTLVFTDQFTRSPGAKYWIPSLDEWLKAAYFDPNKGGTGAGWWTYVNSSDTQLVPGLPGSGETIAGYFDPSNPQFDEWSVPLEAYPHVTSPWGLLDVSGGGEEWLEEVYEPAFPRYRGLGGTRANSPFYPDNNAIFSSLNGTFPSGGGSEGFRIASLVPAPTGAFLASVCLVTITFRGRRTQ